MINQSVVTVTRLIHFRDHRAPHEIRFELERRLMILFAVGKDDLRLVFHASANIHGIPYRFLLRFEAATSSTQCYSFWMEASMANLPLVHQAAEVRSCSGWFDYWTYQYQSTPAPKPHEEVPDRYRAQVERSISAEAHLATVTDIQREIVNAMRYGVKYSTAHKEGGTILQYERGQFMRSDYGDSNSRTVFEDEAAFLDALRKFYDWETSKNAYPDKVSDWVAWKLILRLLERKPKSPMSSMAPLAAVSVFGIQGKPFVALVVLVISILFAGVTKLLMVKTTGHHLGDSIRARDYIVTLFETQEPYIPISRRNSKSDRFRLDLLLTPVRGGASPAFVRLVGGLRGGGNLQQTRLLGNDGSVIWIKANPILGYDLSSKKVITAADLRRVNPELEDLAEQGFYEFKGHLRISSRDDRQCFEVNSQTLKAEPCSKLSRTFQFEPSNKAEAYLCAGGLIKSQEWFGALSTNELARDFRPGTKLPKVYPANRFGEKRQIYRGRVDSDDGRSQIESMRLVNPNEFIGAAFIRGEMGAHPLRLSSPDGFLLASLSQPGAQGTWMVMRVNLDGQVLWKTDTGIGDMDQILPDLHHLGVVGRKAGIPDKSQESVLVVINNETGDISRKSLQIAHP